MSKIKKLYDKLNRKPIPKDVEFEELDKLLKYFGFECRQPSRGGSHYVYIHKELDGFQLTVVKAKPVKPPYVKKAIELINMLIEIRGGND